MSLFPDTEDKSAVILSNVQLLPRDKMSRNSLLYLLWSVSCIPSGGRRSIKPNHIVPVLVVNDASEEFKVPLKSKQTKISFQSVRPKKDLNLIWMNWKTTIQALS